MKALFVDTSAWVAAADAADPLGAAVRRERDEWLAAGGTLVTTDYVVDETLTTIRLRLGLPATEAWCTVDPGICASTVRSPPRAPYIPAPLPTATEAGHFSLASIDEERDAPSVTLSDAREELGI